MKVTHIPFQKTGFFSKTMIDYLEQQPAVEPYYHRFPTLDNFKEQMEEKAKTFNPESRDILADAISKQYTIVQPSEATAENIESLRNANTFTVTTGHQLNLFTGPLYFLYKIFCVINLSEQLSEKYPDHHFVPVYWMATEDHDFDEINYFNFKGKKVRWNREDGGPVGRFSTEGLDQVFEAFSQELGTTRNAQYLKSLFEKGYLGHKNLADATRYIANELFAAYGLVILDGDAAALKGLFAPYVKEELLLQHSYKNVSTTIASLEKEYKIQVNPREINLFYITDTLRERIVKEGDNYRVNDTEILFSEKEMLQELAEYPERFSPNVIMRPLYQEVILPNLCYVGGGGEQAYWLQLKAYFESVGVSFPMLLLRNSVQIVSSKQQKKLNALDISFEELFLKQKDLLAKKVIENSDIQFSFGDAKELLNQQFLALRRVADETDASFIGAVDAQQRKQVKGLENLEKRLLRAEKRRHHDLVSRITILQDELLPNHSLEERQRNFSEFYLEFGPAFISAIKDGLEPLRLEFTVLEL